MCVLPVLTYGSQTWTSTRKGFSKLRICQRRMERTLLNVTRSHRMRSEDIRIERSGCSNANQVELGSHMIRMDSMKWTHAVSFATQNWHQECRKTEETVV